MCIRDGEKLAEDPEFLKNFEGVETDDHALVWLKNHIEDESVRRDIRFGYLFGRMVHDSPLQSLAVAVGTWWHDYDQPDGKGKIKLEFLPTPTENDDEQQS